MGDIREHQVFVIRHLFPHSLFVFRTLQRLDNHCVGLKPVCVVYIGSTWTRSVGFLGMGFVWVTGGIRVLKALRVVILRKSWPIGSDCCAVGCTSLGVTRMEAVTAVHSSGSKTWTVWLIWFLPIPFIDFVLSLLSLCSWLGGVFWVFVRASGGIKGLFSTWVVISLNTVQFRPVGFFHSHLCYYFLGNLSLFCFFVASLEGALTIRATSAFIDGRLGFNVLWGCTGLGVIRKQITTVFRTLLSSPNFCLNFVAPCSGNQSWTLWLVGEGWLQFGLGLFEGFGVGLLWILGFKGEVLNYGTAEGYEKAAIGWVRRPEQGWKRLLLLGMGAARCCDGKDGKLEIWIMVFRKVQQEKAAVRKAEGMRAVFFDDDDDDDDDDGSEDEEEAASKSSALCLSA
ncbi:hypothetical protein HanOQP8_Chr09g0335741 [Helianthus annuus]|nr:hypothetical protein HanIR_Chr09g0434411 [Helianthus annuus]KAJ0712518.1 hypothetical protein HanOQP8_Chr09g0335741 [Helianthus annuus]